MQGAADMRRLSGYERFQILRRTADMLLHRRAELAKTISWKKAKHLPKQRGGWNVRRKPWNFRRRSQRLGGEVVVADGAPRATTKSVLPCVFPCGVVAAITPFNFPLNFSVP